MKLRAIQTLIHSKLPYNMDRYDHIITVSRIELSTIRDTMDHYGLTAAHNSTVIPVLEMEAMLVTMFNQVNVTWFKSNPDHCAELCLNWILNCYDR